MDKLIDKNLNLIYQSQNPLFLVSHLENEKGQKCGLLAEGQRIAHILASQNLVSYKGDFCNLTLEGSNIAENKGWLKHVEAQKRSRAQEKRTKFFTHAKLFWWFLGALISAVIIIGKFLIG